MVTSDPGFLFRYQVTVHALGCLLVLNYQLQMGIRRIKGATPLKVRILLLFCFLAPAIQLPISVIRVANTLTGDYFMADPVQNAINFFWSPMCSIVLVWAMLKYISTSAACVSRKVPKEKVVANVNYYNAVAFAAAGALCSFAAVKVIPFEAGKEDIIYLAALVLSILGTMLEQSYRLRTDNKLSLVSYSWVWFWGSWLYFLIEAGRG